MQLLPLRLVTGGHAREGSEGGVVAAADRPGSFGEQGREGDRADPGQRMQDGCVGRRTALWRRGPLTQACAQLIQLALGLMVAITLGRVPQGPPPSLQAAPAPA